MRFQSRYWIILFASVHFFLHLILFTYTFASAMEKFESGGATTLIEKICQFLVSILQFPIVSIFDAIKHSGALPSVLQYIPFVLNSGLWGMLLWLYLLRTIKKNIK